MLHFIALVLLMVIVAFTIITIEHVGKYRIPTLNYLMECTMLITIDLGLIYILIRLIVKICV